MFVYKKTSSLATGLTLNSSNTFHFPSQGRQQCVEGVDSVVGLPGFESWLYHFLGCVTLGKLFKLSGLWFSYL